MTQLSKRQTGKLDPDAVWARDPAIPKQLMDMIEKSQRSNARCDRAVAHPMRPAFLSRRPGSGAEPLPLIKSVAVFTGFAIKDEPDLALVGEDGLALAGNDGEVVATMSLADKVVGPAVVSPDGLMLAVGIAAKDETWRAVSVFVLNSGEQIHRREHPPTDELSLSWSPKSRFLTIGILGGFGIAGDLEVVDVPARRSLVLNCSFGTSKPSLAWHNDERGDLYLNVKGAG